MTRTAIATWTVALVFATLIGIWVVHEHRIRARACTHGTAHACTEAKKTEDGAILMGVLGAVFLVVFGGVFVASKTRTR
ncbi:MAG: hypothetical protein ABUS54_01135 [Actinomycetota bacterium]